MITAEACRTLARYNRWQNQSLLAAASTLDDAARRMDRGAFFRSVQGTLSHLMWGDHIWMSRFDGWEKPRVSLAESADWITGWDDLTSRRRITDARIIRWTEALHDETLAGSLTWFSGVLGREVEKPLALCVLHFFNHQTHHRGQVHGLVTAAGAAPGDTDLFAMPGDV